MIRLALLTWLAFVSQAFAEPIRVITGDHAGFTRIVVDYRKPINWQVGRTEDGYELLIDGQQPEYDFKDSFKAIGKNRLSSLSIDMASAALKIAMSCDCHAVPFEFREGIIVLDLRDGPAPQGSPFEKSLTPLIAELSLPISGPPSDPQMKQSERYDWQSGVIANLTGKPAPQIAEQLKKNEQLDVQIETLRGSLVGQLSQGASQGLIELTLDKTAQAATEPHDQSQDASKPAHDPVPTDSQPATTSGLSGPAAVRTSLGELPSVSVTHGASEHENLGAQGQTCIPSQDLDFGAWRGETAVSEQMDRATQDIIGEFDKVDPTALEHAVQFYLSIGFGLEARQLILAFPNDLPQSQMWLALAELVDGNAENSGYFAGQMACNTPAALWALLENAAAQEGDLVDSGAVSLAFSDLPIELRRSLGPTLVARFLAIGDEVSAIRARDAILRAPGVNGPQVTLMEAAVDIQNGETADAEQKIQTVIDDPGPATEQALVALVEAKVAQDLPIESATVEALASLVNENEIGKNAQPTARALVLARAASGDFDTAFEDLSQFPDVTATLWRLLARLGNDDAVLSHAVLLPDQPLPTVDDETRAKIVLRLANLGLSDDAKRWAENRADIDPLLLAKVDLDLNDGPRALTRLANLTTPDAQALRAQALLKTGNYQEAAQIFAAIGDSVGDARANAKSKSWTNIAQNGNGDWQAVAQSLQTPSEPEKAQNIALEPLAYGHRLLAQTATTRAAVTGLLAQVSTP